MARLSKKLILLYILSGILCIWIVDRFETWEYVSFTSSQRALRSLREMDDLKIIDNCYHQELSNDGLQNVCQLEYNCSGGRNQTWPADPTIYSFSELSRKFPSIEQGGSWAPCDCKPNSMLAVVIPYRNRDVHLRVLLNNLIPFLQTQKRAFRIFVTEQVEPEAFNRASLLNIGFLEASKRGNFDCFIFHDVDLVPMDLCNLYVCADQPRHLAVAINKFKYELPYPFYCGGALAVHNTTVWAINGFTNVMFGWGGEDDDTFARFRSNGFRIDRYSTKIGRYKMIKHKRDEGNPESGRSLREVVYHWKYASYDGLNTVNYTLISETQQHLYTHLMVKIPGPKDKDQAKRFLKRKQLGYRQRFSKDTELKKKVYAIIKNIREEMRNYNPKPKDKPLNSIMQVIKPNNT